MLALGIDLSLTGTGLAEVEGRRQAASVTAGIPVFSAAGWRWPRRAQRGAKGADRRRKNVFGRYRRVTDHGPLPWPQHRLCALDCAQRGHLLTDAEAAERPPAPIPAGAGQGSRWSGADHGEG